MNCHLTIDNRLKREKCTTGRNHSISIQSGCSRSLDKYV